MDWAVVFDLVLALGASLRLTRFVVADDVPGTWYVKDPIQRRAHAPGAWDAYVSERADYDAALRSGFSEYDVSEPVAPMPKHPRRYRYIEGLACPFCMSVWMSAVVTITLVLAGGPGQAADWWRIPAGFLALAWVTGHIAAWSGDTED